MPTFVACAAYTKRGDPCRNAAKDGSTFCGVHRNMTPEENERLRQIHAADREAYALMEQRYKDKYPNASAMTIRLSAKASLNRFKMELERLHMDPENLVVMLSAVIAPDRATQQRIIQENGIVNASDENLRKLLDAVNKRKSVSRQVQEFFGALGHLCCCMVAAAVYDNM